MRIRTLALIMTLALVGAACGAGSDTVETATSTSQAGTATTGAAEARSTTTTATTQPVVTTAAPTLAAGTLGAFLAAPPAADPGRPEPQSARFDARMDMEIEDENGVLQEISIAFAGAYDQRTASSDITIDMSALAGLDAFAVDEEDAFAAMFLAMFTEPMRMITIGETSWVQWGFFSTFLGAEAGKWIESETGADAQPMPDLGFGASGGSPADVLDALAEANAAVTEIGPDDVRGWPTTHYRAVLDLEEFAAQATPEERAELEASIGAGMPAEFPMDLWIGDDGYLYRFSMDIDAADTAGGLDGVAQMSIVFEMFDYDQVIEIQPPDPADVLTEEELGFGLGSDG